jgi:hypothetical protein
MATRVLIDCDRCPDEATGEHIGPFDLGEGAKMLDLCPSCQSGVGLTMLGEMLNEYGASVQVSPKTPRRPAHSERAPSYQPMDCPICDPVLTLTSRFSAMGHVMAKHDKTKVEASHLVPPVGPSAACSKCGLLCYAGTGLGMHEKNCEGAEQATLM